ncbi:MAG TPA: hypothetical protein VN668_03075 [Stellaceae bacterium]|nr:hypothetical protein [Stellaceae bacterium]
MLIERELVEMADTYRCMAKQAKAPRFKLEFAERAERYETVVSAVRQARQTRQDDAAKESGIRGTERTTGPSPLATRHRQGTPGGGDLVPRPFQA